jgi:PAS domain S-box-containing protein
MTDMLEGKRKRFLISGACWIFAAGMLYVDSLTPTGYADWVLYILPAALICYFGIKEVALISVAAFSLFIALGWFLSPGEHVAANISIFNRSCGIAVTWAISLLILLLGKKTVEIERASSAAREKENRLSAMFDNAAIGIMEADGGFRVVSANVQWCTILGYAHQDLIGMTIFDLTAAEDLQQTRELNAMLAEGIISALNYEKRYLRKDGSPVWTHVTVSAIRNHENRILSYIGTMENIDARKQAESLLEKSEARYRTLFESMDEGFALCEMIFDEARNPVDFRYIEVNRAFSRISGVDAERVLNRRATEAIPGIEPSWIEAYGRVVLTGISKRIINPVLVLGRYFEVFAWRVDENRFAVVFNDVTVRMVLEQELRQRAEELQRAVQELERFSYSLAHGLRTPLRAIVSFAQLLDQENTATLDDRSRSYLNRIRNAGRWIGKSMEDLLDFSQLRSVPMRQIEVDMSAMAVEIAAAWSKTAPSRRADWRIESGLAAMGDPALLHQALNHLLGNAWKFTSRKEIAVIRFGKTSVGGKQAFFIQDNGAGFSMAYVSSLFQPFSRLHTVEQFTGTGIGLAVVSRIIERHHGEIWAKALVNAGATFYFTLPVPHHKGEGMAPLQEAFREIAASH